MKTRPLLLSLFLSVTAALLFSSCGGSPTASSSPASGTSSEQAVKDLSDADMDESIDIYFTQLERLAVVFAEIQDEASAKAQGDTLREITEILQASADRLGEFDDQEVGMIMASNAQRFMEIQQKLMPEIGRVSMNPALAKELQDAMRIPSIQ